MRTACIEAIQNASKRQLTAREVQNIEDRIISSMRNLARNDPASWRLLSESERLQRAGQMAAAELQREADLKQRRVALTIAARQRLDEHINNFQGSKLEALNRTIAFSADGKSNFMSVETRAKATINYALSQLQEAFEAVDPKFFQLFEDQNGVRDLIYEMKGQDTRNVRAKKGAAAWHNVTSMLRNSFNRAGGDIGHLEDWGLPQSHSMQRVGKVTQDKWVSDVIGKLDRNKYIKEDGSVMNDAELQQFLDSAYETIATGGLNKINDRPIGVSGMRANRGNASRQIHFKDAESYLEYQQLYGEKSLWDIMVGHIEGISKDIGLTETYGPNPDHVFQSLLNEITEIEVKGAPSKSGKIKRLRDGTENLYNFISGKTTPVANVHIAKFFDDLRNILIASRLGSALLSSFSDLGTMYLTAKVNNLPSAQLLKNQLAALNPANKDELRLARRAGLSMETLLGSINRWASDNMGPSFARWSANAVMRASGLSAWSDAHKRAFGVTMMGSIGDVVNRHADIKSIGEHDLAIMKSKGITETDWTIWRLAEQEDWGNGNNTMLTPESIMHIPNERLIEFGNPERVKFEAARKLLGDVTEEVDMAVISPGARERMIAGASKQRGAIGDELYRSIFLFKSFPISVVMRHWAMGMQSAGGRVAYLAAFIAGTTVLGALSQQINDIASGKKPRDMADENWHTFWLAALLKGGGLGLYGDFLLSDHTKYGSAALASLLGPVAGVVDDAIKIAQGVPLNAVEGKPEQTGGDTVKFVKGLIPGQNLWYTKAVLDHMVFNQLQEYFSPGYLRRMEKRSKKEFNQTYWWRPQDMTP
ncbi:phage protein [Providencia alcalifaciens]|uniref:phage protein n=1 Tax=Providencia alcalifaciens TaxID=126385 RepID=UPI0003E264E1|nr:phage protein [Providencia alcalifaciens]ETS99949.1 hypothetical protein HMPREF1568_0489 [Providencia alcalifaciens PAL-3]EUD01059.1 hypothetical protein HMPREF1566_3078 [Providencia alcalifaciens PAL-1]